MSPRQRRETASTLIIAVAVAVGAVQMVNSPMRGKLREARASLIEARHRAEQARPGEPDASEPASIIEAAKRRLQWIRAASQSSKDAADLYDHISALADRFGVRVDKMQPTRRDDASTHDGDAISSIAYTIDALAEYESIARFIDALERDLGFSAVVSFQLRPAERDGQPMVRASIETKHHSVRIAELSPVELAEDEL